MARLSTTLKINPSTKLRVNKKKSSSKRSVRVKYFLNLILSLTLIIAGVFLIFWATYQRGWEFGVQKESQDQNQEPKVEIGVKPAKISIPKLNKNLDVSDGFVENNRWKVSTTGVSYLTTSGEIGKVGNAVIYGHNTQGVLG